MHIAIDASRCTVARLTGTERYALEIIRHLILANDALPQPHTLTLYFRDTPSADLFPTSPYVLQRVIPWRRAWTHLRFAAAITRTHPDWTFVPAHTLPFAFRGRAMVTVHDLGYKLFPQAHKRLQRAYLDLTTRYSAARAHTILADSHATKSDLMRFYGTPAHKIQVVYPSFNAPVVRPLDIAKQFGIVGRYFVFIGTLQPRKNIARLVAAFTRVRAQLGDVALVLAGGAGWLYDSAWVQHEGVYALGYIDDADKGALLAQAVGLVFPSLYEGFGFPVLEAMSVGCPVIASDTSSLPELVGEAGLLVNPLLVDAISDAMIRLATDTLLRQRLIADGYHQIQQFSWERSARQILDGWAAL